MKTKVKIIKRLVATIASLCILLMAGVINVGAVPASVKVPTISSTNVFATVSASTYSCIQINPLQCRTKCGTSYSVVRDVEATGNGTSCSAFVKPGSGQKLVASSKYDYIKYKVGGSTASYKYHYYWG